MRIDHLKWSLPAHRRGTLGGMDAAKELTGTYLQRVLRCARARTLQQTRRRRGRGEDTAPDRWLVVLLKRKDTTSLALLVTS
ncbi:hypothetical protein [Xanthomonas oryzae]|nr:hypothetical protein [Xanthomonas oryzae]WVN05065.1 hypothetical protein V1208_11270 [Xanthomonas oryzae pv. oryzicola]